MQPHTLTTLPGGERVITEHIEGVRSASIGLWIGTGSRDESSARAGVSHFIEHLLFKGTERFATCAAPRYPRCPARVIVST